MTTAILMCEETTTWPEAFMAVGLLFGFGFCVWAFVSQLNKAGPS